MKPLKPFLLWSEEIVFLIRREVFYFIKIAIKENVQEMIVNKILVSPHTSCPSKCFSDYILCTVTFRKFHDLFSCFYFLTYIKINVKVTWTVASVLYINCLNCIFCMFIMCKYLVYLCCLISNFWIFFFFFFCLLISHILAVLNCQ